MSFMRGEDDGQTTTHPTPPGPASAASLLVVPILPLVQNVIFPKSVYPLSLRGEQAEIIVQASRETDNLVALFLQQDGLAGEPTASSLHSVGTLARLLPSPPTGDDLTEVVVEGLDTVRL